MTSLIAAEIRTDPLFSVVARRTLFGGSDYASYLVSFRQYDITADDQRFLMIRTGASGSARPVLVLNWLEEVSRIVSGGD